MKTKTYLGLVLALLFGLSLAGQDGTLDDSFGINGKVSTAFVKDNDWGRAVGVQYDGKIVVAGFTVSPGPLAHRIALARYLPDGTPDASFGNDGKVFTTYPGGDIEAHALLIGPDGRIFVAGWARTGSGIGSVDFAVVRYKPDGTLDNTFSGDGIQTTSFGGMDDRAFALALQPDGKLLVAGRSEGSPTTRMAVARYNFDGSLDGSFYLNGKLWIDFGGISQQAYGIAVQPGGKFLVAGGANISGAHVFAVARYTSDSGPDPTFSGDGFQVTDIGMGMDVANAIALQPDGKIVVAGFSETGTNRDMALVRYLNDGTPDPTFHGDGIQTTDFGNYNDEAKALALQPDGKMVVAGWSGYDLALARYHTNGVLDNTFSGDGMLTTSLGSLSAQAFSLDIQPDGKMVVAGSLWTGIDAELVLARYQSNGTLDNSFSHDGIIVTSLTASRDVARSAALQADKKIVVAGSVWVDDWDFALARYLPDGTLDANFHSDGKVTRDIGNTSNEAFAVLVQPDQKIVVAGYGDNSFAVARYLPDGTPDDSFGPNGVVTTPVGTSVSAAFAAALQPDGRILAAGYAYTGANQNFAILRYNPNGSLDPSFGSSGIQITDFDLGSDVASAIVLRPDGRILVAGSTHKAPDEFFAVAQYLPNGNLDNTFDGDGKLTTAFNAHTSVAHTMALMPDGRLVVAGYAIEPTGGSNFAVARYHANGVRDYSFSGDGRQTTDFFNGDDAGRAVVVQSDGKIVVAGIAQNGLHGDFALARYNIDGSPDPEFGINGIVATDFSLQSDIAYDLVIQSDEKLLAVGQTYNDDRLDFDFALARYLSGLEVGLLNLDGTDYAVWVYPNPVRQEATLTYSLAREEIISIRLMDSQGNLVRTFVDAERQAAGKQEHRIALPETLPAGWYLLVIAGEHGQAGVRIIK